TVAFWGPNFDPSKLLALDVDGVSPESGVLLLEDSDNDGLFLATPFDEGADFVSGNQKALPLSELRWPAASEPIDLDGDGVADDMNGDGKVDKADYAWVLTLQPKQQWPLPTQDKTSSFSVLIPDFEKDAGAAKAAPAPRKDTEPQLVDAAEMFGGPAKAASSVNTDNFGDDLFMVVRTSDQLGRFEGFRAVVPATLPARPQGQREAGIQFSPKSPTSPGAFEKFNPDEGPVQEYYGFDMLEGNVAVKLTDMTNRPSKITQGGPPMPFIGIDVSTNGASKTVDSGTSGGSGADKAFIVAGRNWAANAHKGCFLIDSRYEAYEILGNTNNKLTLRSGRPRDGAWRIVQDPSFLEQVIVEFYTGSNQTAGEGEGEGEGEVWPSDFNLSR
ncbi:MAG TPA: hypothetical protein PLI07_13765, partial [Candidatus Hydrogenedentes bacterium]|nr:hypothetical protein [Candidatus Hydrogenedentota bacterium]